MWLQTGIKQGKKCIYCSSKKLCESEDCNYCFDGSLASFAKIAQFISSASGRKPRMISKGNHEHCTFRCDVCDHIFTNTVGHIFGGNQWCPSCKNKTEKILFAFLKEIYPEVKPQPKYDWCVNENNRMCPFDFAIDDKIIELDGGQHFYDVKMFTSSGDEQRERDVNKMKLANDHNYSVTRLLQVDVYQDKSNWKESLISAIDESSDNVIANKYIATDDIYDKHIYDLEQLTRNMVGDEDKKRSVTNTKILLMLKKDIKNKDVVTDNIINDENNEVDEIMREIEEQNIIKDTETTNNIDNVDNIVEEKKKKPIKVKKK